MRPCFKFTPKATNKAAVLALDEEIGFWGTQAKDFRAALDAVDGNELVVEINSPGGEVMAGLGMYNMLRNWAKDGNTITTRVTGVAASIASVIALAGDKREMPKNSFAMVHQVSGGVWGTADDMREAAEVIDKISGSIRGIYTSRMGVDEAKAVELMAKDNWLTADECLEMGFATALTDEIKATAKFDVTKAELPEHVAKVFEDKKVEPENKAELPEHVAKVFEDKKVEPENKLGTVADQIKASAISAGLTDDLVVNHLVLSCESMQAATARIGAAKEIVALCKMVGKAEMASSLIVSNKQVSDARAELTKALAEASDNSAVDTTKKQQTGNAPAAGPAPTEMWDRHEKAKSAGRGKK